MPSDIKQYYQIQNNKILKQKHIKNPEDLGSVGTELADVLHCKKEI